MARFSIRGGKPLNGTLPAAGNKNAVLKMIPAALLSSEPVRLTNVPAISDVEVMFEIMKGLGTKISYDKQAGIVELHTPEITSHTINPDLAKKLRASNMFLGPLLAREGTVTNVFPGGDKIGPREMNAHFDGLKQLGAHVELHESKSFTLSGTMKPAEVFLYEPSVTATENTLLAAVLTDGTTTIENAASEPHVQELCNMLVTMGASIEGIGTNKLTIHGVSSLHGTDFKIPPDFIYIGTFIILAAITGGDLKITDVNHKDLRTILYFFSKLGVHTEFEDGTIHIPPHQKLKIDDPTWARTKGFYSQPWPCFPTDLMSIAIVLATQTEGSTLFFEKMYPGRMFFANYLNGMGANIILADPHRIIVNGKTSLTGAKGLQSPDLRAGMAFVAAGLCAEGETVVESVEHIERGYPNIDSVLKSLGADITRIED
ncbi:UDP-N-acetylglucosamine 1-carboxyvinyltransferase [Candidatus Dojkabacteria bacterium]|uniref:UDP-N-acetylglucosamine 1-carboxyvinyltransferase n=1 Tax=Candidatus Dojkabacteria bacterium TaxID=2099670 RepID=A0A955L799_9BACT|nr:UDP-N-acetylglucosamine 1-carboxyvinyltransferase [Candidatus Dojkabacteria bacterium]